ncbi:MAG: hypothetical protein EU530_10105 [Promethearchaeota archaeon]|nr:MAG: hypothetical protein EU530_10105 [Candidatus Lokiarchaeota archaeon]
MKINRIFVILLVVSAPIVIPFLTSSSDQTLSDTKTLFPQSSDSVNKTELYAVIIGIADYLGINNDQKYSDTDAYFLENKLLNEYLCDPDKITFLHNDLATNEAIFQALDDVSSSIDGNDRFLFYYSGRGLVDDPWSENFSVNIETPHNYEDDSHLYWHINHTGAAGIRVHYSQFVTEESIDFVQLGNISEVISSNNQEFYSGTYTTDIWSGYIPGDNLTVYFHSDSQNNEYGFQIDKYQILNESSLSQGICPYGYFENHSLFINETTLGDKLDSIVCDQQYIILDSSFSGGMIPTLESSNRIILTATDENEFNIENNDALAGCLTGYFRQFMNNLESADIDGDDATSIEEIFNSTTGETHSKSIDIGFEINPQISDPDINYTYLYPSFTWNYSITGTSIMYEVHLDGIHFVSDINVVLFTEIDNSFQNYSLSIHPESGYGNYSGTIDHLKSINSSGILINIKTWDNSTIFLNRDDAHDSDVDTLTDIFEYTQSTNPLSNDTDLDELEDPDEFALGTNPLDNDTDNDSLPDGYEVIHSFNPHYRYDNTSDPDGDDLLTIWEYYNATDPNNPDSDYDRMEDGWEVEYGLLPLDDTDNVTDADLDLLWNVYEFHNNTNPQLNDTDWDGLTDYWEILNGTNPNLNDTDKDELLDGEEIFIYFTNASLDDSDSDDLNDYIEVMESFTDPLNNDTDRDGLTDYLEYKIFESDPLNPDSDGDKLTDDLEWEHHTDPWNYDTDGDGVSDYHEVKYNSDPLDPDDIPDLIYLIPFSIGLVAFLGLLGFFRHQHQHDYQFFRKIPEKGKKVLEAIRKIPSTFKEWRVQMKNYFRKIKQKRNKPVEERKKPSIWDLMKYRIDREDNEKN